MFARRSKVFCSTLILIAAFALTAVPAQADTASEWIQVANDTVLAGGTNPLVTTRVMGIVGASMFDALNGIERRYTPIHVTPDAPFGASRRAAVIQAAYTALVAMYPNQQGTLTIKREAALAALTNGGNGGVSVARGLEWGEHVANQILAWRATDGFTPAPPPYTGSTEIGKWRPTPPGLAPGAAPQFATMTPWFMTAPSQFRPSAPPSLDSAAYADAYNEVKTIGELTSSTRTAEQTYVSFFWSGNTTLYWNRIARQVAAQRELSLSQESLLFGTLNVAIADAGIACWDAKYYYSAWRPVTAIPLADQDSNPATDAQLGWTPLLTTPAHPEFPSGHSTLSGAAAAVLIKYFGDSANFSVASEVRPGTRSFTSFTDALLENNDSRIFGGIHYRPACTVGNQIGASVANHVMQTGFQRLRGNTD
ncbi:MAG TPA: vanadium-dependent haloperoxidase [Terriglobales bacterium]|nr:vanadium-dependent haloperoxidase [Terriglobales bacterium]